MSEQYFAIGECLCGDVKYTISEPPVRMAQCHCDHCRHITGTGHACNAFFLRKAVTIQGETQCYASDTDTGSVITRHFCPRCGSRLYGESSLFPNVLGVAVGNMADTSWFKPQMIVYNKRKPVWDCMDESVPVYEEMPPAPNKQS